MNLDYTTLEKEIISQLEKNKIWTLSTSHKDHVTSRSMSIINKGLDIYFQTHVSYLKHVQMKENKNVSLCFNNISIEGSAEVIGNWLGDNKEIKEIMELYKASHRGSFEKYGSLDGQVVYKVKPKLVKLWKYINGEPFREILDIEKKRAIQLDFM